MRLTRSPTCSRCDAANAPGDRFCAACGQSLAVTPATVDAALMTTPGGAARAGAAPMPSTPPPAPREAAPMVGRESETAAIATAWQAALAGAGTVVLVGGEPGIGKTRLVADARARAVRDGAAAFVFRCSPRHTASELHPVTEWLEKALGYVPGESADSRYAKLRTALVQGQGQPPETPAGEELELLAALLSLPPAQGRDALHLTPAGSRQRTLTALARWLLEQSMAQPLWLAFEDVHWADPSTLAFIELLTVELAEARMLLLATFRPAFVPPWPSSLPAVPLQLAPLPRAGIEAIAQRVAGDRSLPPPVLRQIEVRTGGVPLFVEEFTHSLLESGALAERDGRLDVRDGVLAGLMPRSLHDSLADRLDRLGHGRAVARHAAVVGRRFELALVARIAGLDAGAAAEGIEELRCAGLVHRVDGSAGDDRYTFKHALVQAAAYDSLPRDERIRLHARVADELTASQPALAERQPELLAHHLTESQQWVPAAVRWLMAGQRGLARSANQEAIAHLSAGLALLDRLPRGVREGLELSLLSTIGPALIATAGFGAPQVGEVYARARALCEQMRGRPEFFPCLWGSWVFHLVSGQLGTSLGIAEQMREVGEKSGDAAMRVEAHWTLGDSLFWSGRLMEAERHLGLALQHYDAQAHGANALLYGQDPAVAAECYLACVLWGLGRPDSALAALDRADALAVRRDHIFTTGWVLAFRFMVHAWRREPDAALQAAERSLAFGVEHSHPFWTAAAMIVRGWARARLGSHEDGLRQFHDGLALYDATGSRTVQTMWYGMLAALELDAGRAAEARAALDKGFAMAAAVGERYSEIELLRLRGHWQLQQARPARAAARASFEQALALALAAEARGYALRAATSLHRWLLDEGDAAALAASPLPALLAGFDEGHGTPDLIEARAALDAPVAAKVSRRP